MSGVTAHVQFCGAGGETLGAVAAGVEPTLAMNHWKTAIESHSMNFPDTEHLLADIVCLDPRAYPSADILLTSPECRARSYARGRPKNDPGLFGLNEADERSRATMWDVPRFAEVHHYKLIIVENVIQTVEWCESYRNGHGEKCSCGYDFRRWIEEMEKLGYEYELVSFNSMFAPPVPQSRDRLYCIFWKKGMRRPDLAVPVVSWCPECERFVDGQQAWKKQTLPGKFRVGRYGQQYVYRCPDCYTVAHPAVTPAMHAIDWSLPATRIGDRDRPLAAATIARIERGIEKLAERPMIVVTGGNTYERERRDGSKYARAWGLEQPMPTVTCSLERALVLSNMAHGVPKLPTHEAMDTVTTGSKLYLVETPKDLIVAKNENSVPRPVSDPSPTVTTIPQLYLLQIPGGLVVPLRNGGEPGSVRARHVGEPLPTQTGRQELGVALLDCASGNHHGLLIANYGPGGGRRATSVNPGGWTRFTDEPIGTVTGNPGISIAEIPDAVVVPYRKGSGKPVREPFPTATTVDPYALATSSATIDDCRFRMLEPHEIARAMVMHAHVDGRPYYVVGTKRDQVKQYGNAVTPPVMQRLLEPCLEALAA